MQLPSAQSLLAAWETGRAVPRQTQRALALLSAAYADLPPHAIAQLSIGARDRLLLLLRRHMFGPQLVSVTACPGCRAELEMDFSVDDLDAACATTEDFEACPQSLSLCQDGYDVAFRLPDSIDMLALPEHASPDQCRMRLLERVMERASHGGQDVAATDLPLAVLEAIDAHMALADPQADIRLDLICAECGNGWQAAFDVVSFLWSEVDAWAIRTLRDVHRLARVHGWSEAEILSLSPWRRQCYLDMLDQ
jgi:hypothetical protein